MKKQLSILKAIKGKPSIALQHMIDGLLKQSRRRNFEISMGTFGSSANGICYGCAATCTIQSLSKVNFTPINIPYVSQRAEKTQTNYEELESFEGAMDYARRGYLDVLFKFCGLSPKEGMRYQALFDLKDENWKEQLPEVKKTISKLKKAGY